jgi:hypothetical protein
VGLRFRGSLVGSLAHGQVTAVDPVEGDGSGPRFRNCQTKENLTDVTTLCSGDHLRFNLIGGLYRLRIQGTGIWLSAIGTGKVIFDGAGSPATALSDGSYSLDDGPWLPLPADPTSLILVGP